jgi:hypothetical protein
MSGAVLYFSALDEIFDFNVHGEISSFLCANTVYLWLDDVLPRQVLCGGAGLAPAEEEASICARGSG